MTGVPNEASCNGIASMHYIICRYLFLLCYELYIWNFVFTKIIAEVSINRIGYNNTYWQHFICCAHEQFCFNTVVCIVHDTGYVYMDKMYPAIITNSHAMGVVNEALWGGVWLDVR